MNRLFLVVYNSICLVLCPLRFTKTPEIISSLYCSGFSQQIVEYMINFRCKESKVRKKKRTVTLFSFRVLSTRPGQLKLNLFHPSPFLLKAATDVENFKDSINV